MTPTTIMTPTYIVDGFLGTHGRWERLRRAVDKAGHRGQIWRYDSTGRVSLEIVASRLVAKLRQVDQPFHLIGYSMGGLVIREAMRQAPDLPLKRAALLHSPHGGSLAAYLLPLPACREMRPGSDFLRRLDEVEWSRPTLVTWTAGDLMVLPGRSACWKEASHQVESKMPAHAWPVFSSLLHHRVAKFLGEEG